VIPAGPMPARELLLSILEQAARARGHDVPGWRLATFKEQPRSYLLNILWIYRPEPEPALPTPLQCPPEGCIDTRYPSPDWTPR
jgi:hypothetical protein